ncbi:MAG: urease accessory protein UreE, partial [Sulfuricellaceae bacterium]|nr:urease accessory protein UreE [Sulfuricellaceae bacterium]
MIVIEQRAPKGAEATERLVLPFEFRCKCRLRTRLESGEEAGLFLERGAVLRAGDRLQGRDGRIVEVVAAAEAVMEVRSID